MSDKSMISYQEYAKPLMEALRRIADPKNTHFAGDAQVLAQITLAAYENDDAARAEHQEELAKLDFDGMCKAFHDLIEAHSAITSPFHSPINDYAKLALRKLRHAIPTIRLTSTTHRDDKTVNIEN